MQLMRIYILSTHSVRWHVIKSGSAYRKEKWRTKNMHSGCFLLRLGFIGEEYKVERKILLKNLTGSSAFKNGENK